MTKTPTMYRHLDRDLSVAVGSLYTPSIPEEMHAFDELKPIRNLIAALLARAIEDAQGTSLETSMNQRRKARYWINKDTPNDPFTFSWCCTILDLEPDEIRRILKANKYRFEAFRPDKGTLRNTLEIVNSKRYNRERTIPKRQQSAIIRISAPEKDIKRSA